MTDARLQHFVETAVNSPVKLQITMLFAGRTIRKGTAREIALRAARDIWSVTDALEALVESAILRRQVNDSEAIYVYDPAFERRELLELLAKAYDDPLTRDALHRSIRNLSLPGIAAQASSEMFWGIA